MASQPDREQRPPPLQLHQDPLPQKAQAYYPYESSAHDEIVSQARPCTVLCSTDGSASPNPGPCGAGVSIFLKDPDIVLDLGESLGHGTNNLAELYALGIAFSELACIKQLRPHVTAAHVSVIVGWP